MFKTRKQPFPDVLDRGEKQDGRDGKEKTDREWETREGRLLESPSGGGLNRL